MKIKLTKKIIIGGDFNIIPNEEDVYNPEDWENDAVTALVANDEVVTFEANDADAIEPDIMMVPVVAKLPDIFILPEKLTAML